MSSSGAHAVLMGIGLVLAVVLLSTVLVRLAISYARWRGMLDQPGQRRSHRIPTPRGGGIGMIMALLAVQPWLGAWWSPAWSPVLYASGLATAAVAAIGWWDDHHSLPVLPRLGVQLMAAGLVAASELWVAGFSLWWLPLLTLAGGWCINLHNFMDGIDGLLAMQCIYAGGGIGLLAWHGQAPALAMAAWLLAAAGLGFGWFNRPPARIFMGDVGSGAVGLQLFALLCWLWLADVQLLWSGLMLFSAFVVDAGLTLASRVFRGKSWTSPHREHLYQWLTRRRKKGHGDTVRLYLAWNLLYVTPLVWLTVIWSSLALLICITVYLSAVVLWFVGKRWCLRRDLHRLQHVTT